MLAACHGGTPWTWAALMRRVFGKQPVVDLWAGHADPARTQPWDEDTIVNLYSVGKAVTAICALRLVERGALDLDSPVSRYWPEFVAFAYAMNQGRGG